MEEQASKRRRLSVDGRYEDVPVIQIKDDYISLATISLSGLTTSAEAATDLWKAIANDSRSESIPMDFKDVHYYKEDRKDMVMVRTGPGSKKSPSFAMLAGELSVEEQDILQDMTQATASVPRKQEDLPLLCTRAELSIDRVKGGDHFKMKIYLLWRNSPRCPEKLFVFQAETLYKYLPPAQSITFRGETWSPRDFYENVHVPEKTPELSANIKNDLLDCELFPFQRRAVRWLLEREQVTLSAEGRLIQRSNPNKGLPLSFEKMFLPNGRSCFVSHMLGIATTDISGYQDLYPDVPGGILAEEMGLGKTVEMIALMCLHKRNMGEEDGSAEKDLRNSKATLIISPQSILEQWKQEIELHAPSLKVLHYVGIKRYDDKYVEGDLVEDLANHDVVLCTYNTLANEIHYAGNQPLREFRHKKKFQPRKSPLIQIKWWRVCLDEAQMVESGVSNAAQVARLIPRVNAWAVSGTPLRRDAKDLFGLLLFLRYEPWCTSLQMWDRLLSYFKPVFRDLLRSITIRHSKDSVREDLRLPPQTRNIITVPFSAIEEQHYSQLFQEMCEDCQVDTNGAPLTEDWDPNSPGLVEKMRSWLVRLRQTCLHPEVGGRNRRALGRSEGPLRTVEEVLDVMIDQNESALRADQRAMLLSIAQRGQIFENAKMTQDALDIWTKAYEASTTIVEELKASLAAEKEKLEATDENSSNKEDSEDGDGEPNPKLGAWRSRLRSAQEVQHICIFFMANAYYQIKTNEEVTKADSEEFNQLEQKEEAAYEDAKRIRSELLSEALAKANRLMAKVRTRSESKSLTAIPRMKLEAPGGGIEHRKIYDKLSAFCDALNGQAEQLKTWRAKMVEFLSSSLIDEDEGVELKGDEYEASTKHQDEMYVYMEALRALFADRNDAITGQENTLIAHETKVAHQAAKRDEGPAPTLFLSILKERDEIKPDKELGSLRGIITELRALATSLQWQEGNGSTRAAAELSIVNDILRRAQQMSTDQMRSVNALEREVELFRETMNQRLEYYRALQKISDTVAPYQEEKIGQPLNQVDVDRTIREEAQRQGKIEILLSKRRYLQHLKMESMSETNHRMCIICQSEFETGTLTVCGHQFCKDCIRLWWSEHRTCPMCKRHLVWPRDFHQISYKPKELIVHEEKSPSTSEESSQHSHSPNHDNTVHPSQSASSSIYTTIPTSTLTQIKNIDLSSSSSSFGTKVDTLIRHLLFLRLHDPGAKSVLFSQYREFLDVLSRAFKQHKINYSSIDGKDGLERFKHDPAIECFLLHAKAQSTGINLINASHVFLCEPLINTAIELQAIARIHRIGQHRATSVWMYLVGGTVEQSIYDISLERRLAHLKRKSTSNSRSGTATPKEGMTESAIDKANSLELQEANLAGLMSSGKNGGENVDRQDLWKCLFGGSGKRSRSVGGGGVLGMEVADAGGEMGRFLRAEAAEQRRI